MALFRYRAATAAGTLSAGQLEGASSDQVIDQLRRAGLTPIDVVETHAATRATARFASDGASRRAVINAISELAVLLVAGLTLDRALAVCAENVVRPAEKAGFIALHTRVKEGAPLSRAMAEAKDLFPPMASAMAEAGEANGRLDVALARLAETLERAEALRQVVGSAMVYPAILLVIAVAVILMMLLWVIPQFEGLFSDAGAQLPFMTRMVMGASHAVRSYGAPGLFIGGVGVWCCWPAGCAGRRCARPSTAGSWSCRRSAPWPRRQSSGCSPGCWATWSRAACLCPKRSPSPSGR